jgi:hypothetical protein
MNTDHKDLIIKPRSTDYLMGDGNVTLKAVLSTGDWLPYVEFFERQMLVGGDSNGCVLFTAQESFDAQIEYLIQNGLIDPSVMEWFTLNGYMDTGIDGHPHFHTSPRFIQVLTGNGFNGNSVQDAWDVLRKYGALPYTDLPVNVPIGEYLNPIPQTLLDKASLFLSKIGGTNAIKYHWVCNGSENIQNMIHALANAPLCIGVNVGSNWNSVTPPAPGVTEAPGHCVMNYRIANNNAWIYDHYLPNPKELVAGYPINFALQGIVTPIPPTPSLPPNVTPVTATPSQIQILIDQVSNWLSKLSQIFKGRESSNQMNYSIFKSRTFYTLLVTFAYNVWQLASPSVPPQYSVILDGIFTILASYFHVAGVQNASVQGADLPPAAK